MITIKTIREYTKLLLQDLVSEIDLKQNSSVLISTYHMNQIKSEEDNYYTDIDISEILQKPSSLEISYYDQIVNLGGKYDAIISLFELGYIIDFKAYFQNLEKILKDDGVIIGCFIGDTSFFSTRTKLWGLEENFLGKFYNRILPMIRVTDMNSLFHNFGYKNIVSFVDKIHLGENKLYDSLKFISSLKKDNNNKFENFPKEIYRSIRLNEDKYLEHIEIIAFAASKKAKMFARKLIL